MDAPALRDAAERVLRGETIGSIIREWTQRGIKPVGGREWSVATLVGHAVLAADRRAAGMAGEEVPGADWPAIIDVDTHEQLVKLFSDPARRKHIVGRQDAPAVGVLALPEVRARAVYPQVSTYRNALSYGCGGAGGRCGGVAIKAELLEEYVTGAVLDALESPARAGGSARRGRHGRAAPRGTAGRDPHARRTGRADARRDFAEGTDRPGRLAGHPPAHRRRQISARPEYDRLTGAATVLGDIPPSDGVREAWEAWNTDRRRAAIKAVLHKHCHQPLQAGVPNNPGG